MVGNSLSRQSTLTSSLLVMAGLSVGVNLLLLIPAIYMLQVFDRVLTSLSLDTLAVLTVGAALGLALLFALDVLRSRLQGLRANHIGDSLLPEAFMRRMTQRSGPSQESARDVAVLRQFLATPALLALLDAPWLLVYVMLIAWIHPWLGVAAGSSAVLMLAVAWANDRATRKVIERLQHEVAAPQRQIEDALRQREAVHAMGMSQAVLARWAQAQLQTMPLQAQVAQRSVAMSALGRTLRQAIQVVMLAVGAYLVIARQATPGVMIAATLLLGRALAPVEQVVANWRLLVEGHLAWRRLMGADAVDEPAPVMPLPQPNGELVAEEVSLTSPDGERRLLHRVSLKLAAGESLAIIGPSGAGKTTLVRLLLGLQPPTSGVVRLDGVDVAHWERGQLGPWVGYVPQDIDLLAGTVAENIARMGTVQHEQVVEAARRARVHQLVLGLPLGYDTPVGAGGHPLSPGQRQRVALARALYGSPRLLLLDEPNANLDGAGELALVEALRELHGHSTVVLVTHRLGLLTNVDRILVLEAGQVARVGPAAEMLHALRGEDRSFAGPLSPGPRQPEAPPRRIIRNDTPAAR